MADVFAEQQELVHSPLPPATSLASGRTLRVGTRTLRVTAAYDTYWRFAAERQALYFRRLRGDGIWTTDPVLQNHRFTNVYRAADRVSQYLISTVASGSAGRRDAFFRTLFYKVFNRVDVFRRLEAVYGALHVDDFERESFRDELAVRLDTIRRKESLAAEGAEAKPKGGLYSAAYIMPSPAFGSPDKHRNHIALLRLLLRDEIDERVMAASGLREIYEILRSVPSFGNFLAYQFAIDLGYAGVADFDENEFVVPGPGARDGIAKCFADVAGLSDEAIIAMMVERAPAEFERLGLRFFDLWGRPLHLIDAQNLFCEVDKYCRVAHPELNGRSGRTRIKQRFAASTDPLPAPVFPAHWNIDARVVPDVSRACFADPDPSGAVA